jgi:hypothetical protein
LVAGPEKMNTAAPIPALTLTIHSVQHFEPTADSDAPYRYWSVPVNLSAQRTNIAATVEPAKDEPGGNLPAGGAARPASRTWLKAGRRP